MATRDPFGDDEIDRFLLNRPAPATPPPAPTLDPRLQRQYTAIAKEYADAAHATGLGSQAWQTLKGIGSGIAQGLSPTNLGGHVADVLQSGKPNEANNVLDQWDASRTQQQDAYQQSPDAFRPTLLGRKGELVRDISQQMPQMVENLGGMVGGAMLGAGGGPVGMVAGAVLGGGASLVPAYHASETQTAREALTAEAKRRAQAGQAPMTLADRQAYEQQIEPQTQKIAAAEVGSELPGMAIEAIPMFRLPAKLGGAFAHALSKPGLKAMGSAGLKAAAATAATEPLEEAASTMVQQPIEQQLGIRPATEAPYQLTNPADWGRALGEVAAPTLRGMIPQMLLGGGIAAHQAARQGVQNYEMATSPPLPEDWQPPAPWPTSLGQPPTTLVAPESLVDLPAHPTPVVRPMDVLNASPDAGVDGYPNSVEQPILGQWPSPQLGQPFTPGVIPDVQPISTTFDPAAGLGSSPFTTDEAGGGSAVASPDRDPGMENPVDMPVTEQGLLALHYFTPDGTAPSQLWPLREKRSAELAKKRPAATEGAAVVSGESQPPAPRPAPPEQTQASNPRRDAGEDEQATRTDSDQAPGALPDAYAPYVAQLSHWIEPAFATMDWSKAPDVLDGDQSPTGWKLLDTQDASQSIINPATGDVHTYTNRPRSMTDRIRGRTVLTALASDFAVTPTQSVPPTHSGAAPTGLWPTRQTLTTAASAPPSGSSVTPAPSAPEPTSAATPTEEPSWPSQKAKSLAAAENAPAKPPAGAMAPASQSEADDERAALSSPTDEVPGTQEGAPGIARTADGSGLQPGAGGTASDAGPTPLGQGHSDHRLAGQPLVAPVFTDTGKDNAFRITNLDELGGVEAVRARLKAAKLPPGTLETNGHLRLHRSKRDAVHAALQPTPQDILNDYESQQLPRQSEPQAAQGSGTQGGISAHPQGQAQTGQDPVKSRGTPRSGFTTLPNGRTVANRVVDLSKLSAMNLNRLLTKAKLTTNEAERLKDYKWTLLYDEQGADSRGLLSRDAADGGSVTAPKNKAWLTNIDAKLGDSGVDAVNLDNNTRLPVNPENGPTQIQQLPGSSGPAPTSQGAAVEPALQIAVPQDGQGAGSTIAPIQPNAEPLSYDPATNRHSGQKLERGTVLNDAEGNRYQLERNGGFMLTVDKLNEQGQPIGTESFSVDPTDKDRYKPLFAEAATQESTQPTPQPWVEASDKGEQWDETRWFESRVRVLPGMNGDTIREGTVTNVLRTSSGRPWVEVKVDGQEGSVRITPDRLEVLSIKDSAAKPAAGATEKSSVTAPTAEKPDPGQFTGQSNTFTASPAGQTAMAHRANRTALLTQLNAKVAEFDPGAAYSEDQIFNAADDRIDAMRDWLVSKHPVAKAPVAETPGPVSAFPMAERPDGWRENTMKARQVAQRLGIPLAGKKTVDLLREVDTLDQAALAKAADDKGSLAAAPAPAGGALMPGVVAVYHTQSGKVGAEVRRAVSSQGRVSYHWNGAWGAASGSLEHVQDSVKRAVQGKRGVRLVAGEDITGLFGAPDEALPNELKAEIRGESAKNAVGLPDPADQRQALESRLQGAQFKKVRFQVALSDGKGGAVKKNVQGVGIGRLVVHKSASLSTKGQFYVVSHEPTGMSILDGFDNQQDAQLAAARLDAAGFSGVRNRDDLGRPEFQQAMAIAKAIHSAQHDPFASPELDAIPTEPTAPTAPPVPAQEPAESPYNVYDDPRMYRSTYRNALESLKSELTPGGDALDFAQQRRDEARVARQALKADTDDPFSRPTVDAEDDPFNLSQEWGDLHNESDYDHHEAMARVIADLGHQVLAYTDIDETWVTDLMQSSQDDAAIVRQLQGALQHGRARTTGAETHQALENRTPNQETRSATGDGDLFPAADAATVAAASRLALIEAQKEQQRRSNATQTPPPDTGLLAQDNRQEDIEIASTARPAGYGANNTVFTKDAADAAREVLRRKLNQLNAGFDPEIAAAGLALAGYHIEAGARAWADYTRAMVADIGEAVRPYLRSFYESARYAPGLDNAGMTSGEEIDRMVKADHLPDASKKIPEAADKPADKPASVADTDKATPKKRTLSKKSQEATNASAAETRNNEDGAGGAEGTEPEAVRGAGGERATAGVGAGGGGDVSGGGRGRGSRRVSEDGQDAGVSGKGADVRDGLRDGAAGDHGPAVPVRGPDYRIATGELKRTGGWKTTAERNLDIIDLARTLEKEGRPATREEQALLTRFTGWGASEIRQNLFPVNNYSKEITPYAAKPEWKPLVERALEILSPEELKTALRSTQYAHYTSEAVVRSIYSGLERLGFAGGKVLDPGSGISLFAGLMPDAMAQGASYTGVEMDKLSASIAKLLYPRQHIINGDFSQVKLPKDYFDLAVGNPPFAAVKITDDPEYKSQRFALHDYFFAKSIDRVRPGGLMAFVTSRYTLDKQGDKARQYLADRADLLGAIRLPQTAFQQNAGTEVVTDVLFLQKRQPGAPAGGASWLKLEEVTTPEGPALINEYFVKHPQMVLGRHSLQGTMYGKNEYTVLPGEGDIEAQFAKAVERLPAGVYSPARQDIPGQQRAVIERDFNPKTKKEGALYLSDAGVLMRVEQGAGQRLDSMVRVFKKNEALLKDYVGLRDAVKQAQYDQLQDGDWETSLAALQAAHKAFVEKHGHIRAYTLADRFTRDADGEETVESTVRYKNLNTLLKDVDAPLVWALEAIDENGKIVDGPFLKGRTIGKPVTPKIVTTADALAVSLNDRGGLDLAHVASLSGRTVDEVKADLGPLLYDAPGTGWQLADEYLSGDVVTKLEEAEAAARHDEKYRRNVEALLAVQPKPLAVKDIPAQLGANWIPAETMAAFAQEVLEEPYLKARWNSDAGLWLVEGGGGRGSVSAWGTPDRSPTQILEAALNNRTVKVTRTDPVTKSSSTDTTATAAANEAVKKMREAFARWLWTDSGRVEALGNLYNCKFNNIVPRSFDGSHLTLPGVSLRYQLYPHQKRGIWRIIQTGDTYLAHAVGAGKTMTLIAAGMEQRRLGLIKKPMYVVPNHMLGQFAAEFLELYPLANIMVADEENFTGDNRRRFVAQAALNDPDAIIIKHSAFERIKLTAESWNPIIQEQIDRLQGALDDVDSDDRISRRRLEAQIEGLERKLIGRTNAESKDQAVTFEELGVDFLFVDECFTHDTLVETDQGLLPIGRIVEERLPVRVLSHNSDTHALEWKPVINWYRHSVRAPLIEVVHEHGSFICTANHNIWTGTGYTKAGLLEPGVSVLSVRHGIHAENHWATGQEDALLRNVLLCSGEYGQPGLPAVREAVCLPQQGAGEQCQAPVLLDIMPDAGADERSAIHGGVERKNAGNLAEPTNQGPLITAVGGAHAAEESDAESGYATESQQHAESHPPSTAGAGREWPTDSTAKTVGGTDGDGNGARHQYSSHQAVNGETAKFLQSRPSGCVEAAGCGGGRAGAPNGTVEGAGREEGSGACFARVERIEVLQSSSDGGYQFSGQRHHFVYDIEVADNHNYFANGALVSNSHEYRKLDFATNRSAKGINPAGSAKALDLYGKARWLQGRQPGRALAFASGTPITNTMGELYSVMRFFAREQLEKDDISHFDAWATMFGEVSPELEMNASGKYEVVERFSKFVAIPELMKRVRTFMDVLTSSQLGDIVKRPDIAGGGRQIRLTPASDRLSEYLQGELAERIEKSRKWKPTKEQPNNPDPMIAIIGDGRLAAIDMRFVTPNLVDDPESKLNALIDDLIAGYEEGQDVVFTNPQTGEPEPIKGTAMVVFSVLGFGQMAAQNRGFSARNWVMKRLKQAGIPASEVAWMMDYQTAAQKEAMFKEMRNGKKRILIGSPKNMGTGVNVQKRLARLFFLDPPWYPSDVEQAEGRILRQGNQNATIKLDTYATKGSYDSTMWQMIARKARFIEQAFTGDDSVRTIEDVSEASQYAMASALASGDERAIQLAGLQADVERLTRLQDAHFQEQAGFRRELNSAEYDAERLRTRRIPELKAVVAKTQPIWGDEFKGAVDGRSFVKRKEFGEALIQRFNAAVNDAMNATGKQTVTLGKIGGLHPVTATIRADAGKDGQAPRIEADVTLRIADQWPKSLSNPTTADATGLVTRLLNAINGVEGELNNAKAELKGYEERVRKLKGRLGGEFAHAQELADKIAETAQLTATLEAEGKATTDAATGAAVAEGMRAEGEDAPKFSRGEEDGHSVSQVRTALQELAKHDELFKLPRPAGQTVSAIADEIDPAIQVRETTPGRQWAITMPGGAVGVLRKDRDGKLYLDASRLASGVSQGYKLYAIAAAYAFNNGLVFKGDPNGLSPMAKIRRTEHLLSSALKYGTTRHLEPDPSQNIEWNPEDEEGNLERLLAASYRNAVEGWRTANYSAIPEIDNITFSFDAGRFERIDTGAEVTNDEFDAIAKVHQGLPPRFNIRRGESPARAGRNSIKRAALIGALLRAARGEVPGAGWGGGRNELLEKSARERGTERLAGLPEPLENIFYQRAASGQTGGNALSNPPSTDQSAAQALNRAMVRQFQDPSWNNAYVQRDLPESLAEFARAAEAAFGSPIIGITGTEERFDQFNGINAGGRNFVNLNAPHGFAYIAGHELLHQLKRDRPDLYQWFAGQAKAHYKNLPAYKAKLDKLIQPGEKPFTRAAAEEELLGDFTGDALADPVFVEKLAKADPSRFRQLLNAVIKWLQQVGERLTGKGLGASAYFKDVEALREHLAKALVAYSQGGAVAAGKIAGPKFHQAWSGINTGMPDYNAPGPQGDAQQGAKQGNVVTEQEEMDSLPAKGFVRLYHAGSDKTDGSYFETVPKGMVFDGFFALRGGWGNYGTGAKYFADVPESAVLTQQAIDYDIAYDEQIAALREVMHWLDDDDVDLAAQAVLDDQAHKLDDDDLMRIFKEDTVGEASWYAQNVRGQVAKILGYQAVEMDDENGTSILIVAGVPVTRVIPNDLSAPDSTGAKFSRRQPEPNPTPTTYDGDPEALFAEADRAVGAASRMQEAKAELSKRGEQLEGAVRRQWLGALTVHQLVEIGQKLMPRMTDYLKEMTGMDVTRNNVLQEVDAIAWDWEKLDKRTLNRLALVMHEATIAGVDGAEDYRPIIDTREAVKQMGVLRRRQRSSPGDKRIAEWQGEIKVLQRQVANEKNRAESYGRIVAMYEALPEDAKAVYLKARDYHVVQSRRVEEALADMIRKSNLSGRPRAAAALASLRKDFEAARVTAPYFPLGRDGDYWVSVQNPQGEWEFHMYQTFEEQDRAIKAFRAEGMKIQGRGKKLEGLQETIGVPMSFVAEVETLLGQMGEGHPLVDAIRDQVYQLYLKRLSDLSVRKHFIHRKKMAGFGQDALLSFAKKGYHDAFQYARVKHGFDLRSTMEKLGDDLKVASSKPAMAKLKERRERLLGFQAEVLGAGLSTQEVNERATSLSLAAQDNATKADMLKRPLSEGEQFVRAEADKWREYAEWMRNWAQSGGLPGRIQQELHDIAVRIETSRKVNAEPRGFETAANMKAELDQAYAHLMHPQTSRWANTVNQIGYLWHLAFSPAAWITNATQTPLITMPYVAAQHGLAKTTAAFNAAFRQATRGAIGGKKDSPLSIREALTRDDEQRAYAAALERGLIDHGRALDLAGVAEEGATRSAWHRKFALAMTWGFHDAERLNREVSFMAAYRLARDGGASEAAAIDYGAKVVTDTHFNYTNENRPRFLRGDLMRVLGQFKLYSQHVTYLQWRALQQAMGKGASAAEKSEARRFLLFQTGVQLAAGGVLGLPLGLWGVAAVGAPGLMLGSKYGWKGAMAYAATVIGAAVALGDGDDDDPTEWEAEFQQAMKDWFGATGGAAASKGLVNALGGIDLSTRVSQRELWWRELDADLDDRALWGEVLSQAAGPGLGTGASLLQGLQMASQGDVWRGIEKMLPKATKDVMTAIRLADEGAKTIKGDTLVESFSPWEVAAKGVGFSPSRLAARYDENRAEKGRQRDIEQRRSRILGDIADARLARAKALKAGESPDDATQKVAAAMAAMRTFNQAQHKFRITPETIQDALSARRRARKRAKDGVFLNRKIGERYDYAAAD